jgi:hypothetical protein
VRKRKEEEGGQEGPSYLKQMTQSQQDLLYRLYTLPNMRLLSPVLLMAALAAGIFGSGCPALHTPHRCPVSYIRNRGGQVKSVHWKVNAPSGLLEGSYVGDAPSSAALVCSEPSIRGVRYNRDRAKDLELVMTLSCGMNPALAKALGVAPRVDQFKVTLGDPRNWSADPKQAPTVVVKPSSRRKGRRCPARDPACVTLCNPHDGLIKASVLVKALAGAARPIPDLVSPDFHRRFTVRIQLPSYPAMPSNASISPCLTWSTELSIDFQLKAADFGYDPELKCPSMG